jgi:hypothetical protein
MVIVVGAVAGAGSARAAIIRVPDDAPSIGEAIEAAAPGDTIVVKAGSYTENLVIGQPVHILGEDGARPEIIGSESQVPVIKIEGTEGPCTIQGLKINGKWRSTSGIEAIGTEIHVIGNEFVFASMAVTLRGSRGRIVDNDFRDNGGGDIRMLGSTPLLARNRFHGPGGTAIRILGKKCRPVIGGSPGEGNTFAAGYETLISNESKNDINAQYNQWHWSATVDMNSKGYPANVTAIRDGFDNPDLGKVDYRNWVHEKSGGMFGRVAIPVVIAVLIILVIVVRTRARARR